MKMLSPKTEEENRQLIEFIRGGKWVYAATIAYSKGFKDIEDYLKNTMGIIDHENMSISKFAFDTEDKPIEKHVTIFVSLGPRIFWCGFWTDLIDFSEAKISKIIKENHWRNHSYRECEK